MVKGNFQRISSEENGVYEAIDRNYLGRGFSRVPVTNHKLVLTYKSHQIKILYELGSHNLGKVIGVFPKNLELPFYEIEVQSHFRRLFNRKKNILTVKSEDEKVRNYLQQKIEEFGLEDIARDSLFQPKMFIERDEETLKLITEYHLEFGDKVKVIQPMIRLYEAIVDFTLNEL